MSLKGFTFSVVEAAIKKPGRKDLALIYSDTPATAAAVFTTNKVKAAPVLLSAERIAAGCCQALIVNSGNANACTGQQGMLDARETSRLLADGLQIAEELVQVSSTGVIGVPLPMDRVRSAIPSLVAGCGSATLDDLAAAIMTTDTFPKTAVRSGSAGGVSYTVAGTAKGAGMIMPNMATMLSFVMTDAAIGPDLIDTIFRRSVDRSFNAITIDGDTSTNDTCLLMANGAANTPLITGATPEAENFARLLDEVLLDLAKQIVKDGEGATKFVEIRITGACTDTDAKQAALSVANSSLVKTAFFGQDANWGRIFAAVGYSGVEVNPDLLALWFDDVCMAKAGIFNGDDAEQRGTEVLRRKEFVVTVDLGLGDGRATVYTSDLSHEYVSINADYRT
jgi:glutamate N-acetyltransferase/amino-acid N-acetyltransferase